MVILLLAVPIPTIGQQYDHFEVEKNDLFWRYTYDYAGAKDSLRREVVQMLKSKFFTFNVVRNEAGYNGELKHYKVDCKRYGRTYLNTPRMYCEGEWIGKFTVEVVDNHYQVNVYALYYEKMEKSTGYYRTEKPIKGRYIDAVLKKNRSGFKKSEFANMALMGLSLRDDFDIKK
jgi:hypothetical protein